MGQQFSLKVTRMKCLNEQSGEWGKDEMRLFGFAISRTGRLFATGYRNLGSYSSGDDRATGVFPMTLVEGELDPNGLEMLLYLWWIEEDSGGVSGAATALEASFRAAYRREADKLLALNFPRTCIPFTAFYKAVLPFRDEIYEASTNGINNDELYEPFDLLLERGNDPLGGLNFSREIKLMGSKMLGLYEMTLNCSYEVEPVVHP